MTFCAVQRVYAMMNLNFIHYFFYPVKPCTEYKLIQLKIKKKIRKKKFLFSSTYQYFDTLFNENLFSDIEYLTCNKIFEMSHVHSYRLVSLVY